MATEDKSPEPTSSQLWIPPVISASTEAHGAIGHFWSDRWPRGSGDPNPPPTATNPPITVLLPRLMEPSVTPE